MQIHHCLLLMGFCYFHYLLLFTMKELPTFQVYYLAPFLFPSADRIGYEMT